MTNPPTPLRPRDLALFEKQCLRTGLELCGLSVPQLADLLGIDDDTLEAIVSPTRPNHVPSWFERHPRFPRALRDFMRAERDRAAGEPALIGAESPGTAGRIAMCAIGNAISAVSAAGDPDDYSAEAAAQVSRCVKRGIAMLQVFDARLGQRAVTGGHAPARGAS